MPGLSDCAFDLLIIFPQHLVPQVLFYLTDQKASLLPRCNATVRQFSSTQSGGGHAKLACLLCRQYAEEYHISQELRKLLPRDEGKPIEKPAERALRERM